LHANAESSSCDCMLMGLGRSRKKSQEKMAGTTSPAQAPPATAPTRDVIQEALSLINQDQNNTGALQKRRRNSTPAVLQHILDEDDLFEKRGTTNLGGWTDKSEAAKINDLIKAGTGAVRERRKSKEGGTPAKPKAEEEKPKVKISSEALEINRKIAEDRRVRRASKEHDDAEKEAMKKAEAKLLSLSDKVREVEAEAEAEALAHDENVANARTRGAAKAAAKNAGGVFHTYAEYQALMNAHKAEVSSQAQRIETLEAQLSALKAQVGDGSAHKGSVFGSLATSFKRSKSPTVGARAGSSPNPLRRQASSSGSSFKKIFKQKSQQNTTKATSVGFAAEVTDQLW